MMGNKAFHIYLRERWRFRLFSRSIFPGRPFRDDDWLALAFNRDRQGNRRLPTEVWATLLQSIESQTSELTAFVCSEHDVSGGAAAAFEQPLVVRLTVDDVLAHFTNSECYLPEFWMAGVSEEWAVWGDSDFTVLGGAHHLLQPLLSSLGGIQGALAAMRSEFEVGLGQEDEAIERYLSNLIDPSRTQRTIG